MSAQTMLDYYDGESGTLLVSLPAACAYDCSRPGQPADDAVAHWRDRVTWHVDDAELRASLQRFGAWDDLDEAETATLQNRVLWIAACDFREEGQISAAMLVEDVSVSCDNMTGTPTCDRPVTMIDKKGYAYCEPCGLRRRASGTPCRKLRASELVQLRRGDAITHY